MSVYVETDKTKELQYRLLNPHYTDDRFRQSQTVFLAPGYTTVRRYSVDIVEGVSYDYSDRLHQWHGEKCDEAWKAAEARGFIKNSPALLEAYLQELFGGPRPATHSHRGGCQSGQRLSIPRLWLHPR